MSEPFQAILLPGAVLPAEPAYAALVPALGREVEARAKDLELYRGDEPPADYTLDAEGEGILREAEDAGFERFHLVGYSGGGAAALVFTAEHHERVLSLALLEPAWIGWADMTDEEQAMWDEQRAIRDLPPEEFMPRFVRVALKPGVEAPRPPADPPPPWMAKRPPGISALTRALDEDDVDHAALRRYDRPVYCQLGSLSSRAAYELPARRLGRIFPDFTLEVFEGRHHFDPPHRVEPERLAASLLALWRRAEAA